MTVLTRNPGNLDLFQSTKFRLVFSRLPGTTFFCQSINIPGVSLTEIPRYTPFVDLFVPGEKIVYDTLNINFLVDEQLQVWEQLHDWIRAMTFPKEFYEYRTMDQLSQTNAYRKNIGLPVQYTDAVLSIHSNKNNPTMRFHFKDVFPTALTAITMNAADTADIIITSDATFRFSYYEIERIS